jgi:hypothetical protein
MRIAVTLLLAVFLAMFSLTWIGYLLITNGVLQFDIVTYMLYVSLVDFGIILLIGLAMIKLKELYLLPAFIVIIAYFSEYSLSSNRDLEISGIQIFSYLNYGHVIGNPLAVFLGFISATPTQIFSYEEIWDLLFDPLRVVIPRIDITVISIYLLIISAPTIVLFYYIALKNRSGRSLGFATGLIVLNLTLIFGMNEDIVAITTLVATVFFSLGIFGIFDRIAKTKPSETEAVAAKRK